jgi:hypothetical protein
VEEVSLDLRDLQGADARVDWQAGRRGFIPVTIWLIWPLMNSPKSPVSPRRGHVPDHEGASIGLPVNCLFSKVKVMN